MSSAVTEPPAAWGQIGSDHPLGAVECRLRRTIIGHQLHYLLYYHFLGPLPTCCIHHRIRSIRTKKYNCTSESVFGIRRQPYHYSSTDPPLPSLQDSRTSHPIYQKLRASTSITESDLQIQSPQRTESCRLKDGAAVAAQRRRGTRVSLLFAMTMLRQVNR